MSSGLRNGRFPVGWSVMPDDVTTLVTPNDVTKALVTPDEVTTALVTPDDVTT